MKAFNLITLLLLLVNGLFLFIVWSFKVVLTSWVTACLCFYFEIIELCIHVYIVVVVLLLLFMSSPPCHHFCCWNWNIYHMKIYKNIKNKNWTSLCVVELLWSKLCPQIQSEAKGKSHSFLKALLFLK